MVCMFFSISLSSMGRDGVGWDGMGLNGIRWDGMGSGGMRFQLVIKVIV